MDNRYTKSSNLFSDSQLEAYCNTGQYFEKVLLRDQQFSRSIQCVHIPGGLAALNCCSC